MNSLANNFCRRQRERQVRLSRVKSNDLQKQKSACCEPKRGCNVLGSDFVQIVAIARKKNQEGCNGRRIEHKRSNTLDSAVQEEGAQDAGQSETQACY